MQRIVNYFSIVVLTLAFVACNSDKTTPGYVFMDDMYRSPGVETYAKTSLFKNGMAAQLPVAGTVARGYVVYEYENSQAGYDLALTQLKMPEAYKTEQALADGKLLYTMFCTQCHGEKGDGQGPLSASGKFPGVPAYNTRPITEGSIYHVLMYGRNLMGSHASQLNNDERWKVVRYVQFLRGGSADTTSTPAVVEVAPAVVTNDQQG